MATADNTNVLGSFLRAFQQGRQGVTDRQQAAQALALNEQLKQLQIATAQAQLLEAQKTPQQRDIEAFQKALAQRTVNQGGVRFQPGGPVEEITPEAQQLIDMRQIADQQAGIPFNREGISGIEMQTAVPGYPGFVQSPALQRSELAQDLARITAETTARTAAKAPPGPELREVGNNLVRVSPEGKSEVVFTAPAKSDFKFEFVKNIENPKDVRYLPINPETGSPPEGYTFVKSGDSGMKPSEVISSRKEIRDTYEKLPSKLDYFGTGQVKGTRSLKEDLDSVLKSKSVNGDFNKLSGTASDYFITRMNKLSDPTSATLIAEADRIAGRVGVGDKLFAYVRGLKTGQEVAPEIAKQIYELISSVEASQKEQLINSLIPFDDDIKLLGKDLTFIGVPSDIQKEVEARIASGQSSPATTAPTGSTKVGDKKTFPNGKVGVWDGTGWKAQ